MLMSRRSVTACGELWRRRGEACRLAACILVGLLMAPGLPGCGDGEDGKDDPKEEQPEPIAFTQKVRALVLAPGDSVAVGTSPALDEAELPQLFAWAVLRQQLLDEFSLDADLPSDNGPPDRSFATRIMAGWEEFEQSYPPFEGVVIVLDLFTVDGTKLVAPSTVNPLDRSFLKGPTGKYSQHVLQQVRQAATDLAAAVPSATKLLLVLGEGLNRTSEAEFAAFKSFYAEHLQPEVKRIAEDHDREIEVTTSLDWEAFVRALDQAGSGTSTPAADTAAWTDLLDGIADKLDLLVVQSVLRGYETLEDLPQNHYQRLRALLGPHQPVAFLPVYWPCRSGGDVAGARAFLKEFHFLAAGLNLAFFAWPRFFDASETQCGRLVNNLGAPSDLCYAGLVKSAGNPKSLWDMVLDAKIPTR